LILKDDTHLAIIERMPFRLSWRLVLSTLKNCLMMQRWISSIAG